ncbi:hypothetical protein H6G54_23670 [Anabaena cylindrica FACHB-243]|uniref:Uncharacterized protein n=1 Tax=Anabaena cylindrica (strain ATCC 27899 / PCC 7122) TaxID=272123 RepID=K9ZKZ7_ANACC|nr:MULTISPECIES: hypothetical protein [Anabaena]AFZ59010.1 hypothetical protein Anacy_3617 [Anabaena cylindrica PCC 7122]MBD2420649.1 hypothetical protein [Anabaena cylindrica FACHB-243]MBY5283846.1 hypothetical protein [Anabaena sp. CCAP 1446/1C]MBY5310150.1 hypothetical protein [Anabaena sp. CCAP 1446/1C]MCM2408609.1 hypothetical protein [Anabaena sp. CCAP 1446/1C]
MDAAERHARIVDYLRIKPISHGQIYTFQIAVPAYEIVEVSLEKQNYLKNSLTQQGTNLIPLIVRRTEEYTEEEEYEVVYGADWCLVAKEIDIEKLWVWVFDLTDEQAVAVKQEMQQLLGNINSGEKIEPEEVDIGSLIEQKLKPIYAMINQLVSNPARNAAKYDSDDNLRVIESKIENLLSAFEAVTTFIKKVPSNSPTNIEKSHSTENINVIENRLDHLLSAVEKLTTLVEQLIPPPPPQKFNLLTATNDEIKSALKEAKVNNDNHIKGVLDAIKYWQQSGRTLTWENLQKSTKSGQHKIKNFANGTYQKLKDVADIRTE